LPRRVNHISGRKEQRERLPLISMAIIAGILFFLIVIIFTVWIALMPGKDTQPDNLELSEEQYGMVERLEEDVRYLADSIGERNMHRPGTMDTTISWIERRFTEIGYNTLRHTYRLQRGIYGGRSADNLIAEITGTENSDQIIIIGAHYDTVPGSPGANDNSSAVAVLLELAHWFHERPQSKTLRFVVFANEEPPFFKTVDMGSYAYAQKLKEQKVNVEAMISMDGLGYFSDEPGSQNYPFPGIGLAYPDKANFIGFVTRFGDLRLMKRALSAFREGTELPAEGVALPGIIPGVSWSDHWSFWQHDFPAFLVTDTLPFRDPNYHSIHDTPDKLDFNRMALLAEGMKDALIELAN
jgi:hypothetical protein